MSGTATRPPRAKSKRRLLGLAVSLLVVLLLCGVAEVALRCAGIRPWPGHRPLPTIAPGGSLFRADPRLGYTHLPGAFDVTLPGGYTFRVTHLPSTLRVTHPLETYPGVPARPEIWIFGCSFTHGWSLNDDETYPWLLQEHLPEYELVNFGVSGYGTLHALLQMREGIARTRPRLAVLAYASFHNVRNTFVRSRQKAVVTSSRLGPLVQPYARLGATGALEYSMATREYREFPLMRRSALAHYLEMAWNELESRSAHSDLVTQQLVLEMDRATRENGTRLVVALIVRNPAMRAFLDEHRIPNVDISVDLRKKENTNKPHDGHPSALANRRYADALETFLRARLAEPAEGPDPPGRTLEALAASR